MPRRTRRSSIQRLAQVGAGLLLSYVCLCLLLRWGQTRLMFFPSSELKATPAAVGLPYEEIWLAIRPESTPESALEPSQEQVHGWWIAGRAPSEAAATLLYLHGNGSNLGDLVHRAARLHQLGINLLLIDYRGYGQSWGEFPSEASVYEDAEISWQYLTQTRQIASSQILLYGQSLGGAVAIELATRHPAAAGVIVESSFTSMREMVKQSIPNFLPPMDGLPMDGLPIDWILTQHFDSLTKVRWLKVPILLIHGTEDRTIPATMSQDLFAAAPEPKQLLLIPHADHNTVLKVGGDRYLKALQVFVKKYSGFSFSSYLKTQLSINHLYGS